MERVESEISWPRRNRIAVLSPAISIFHADNCKLRLSREYVKFTLRARSVPRAGFIEYDKVINVITTSR